jgi:NADPH:quinone reductase
MSSSITKLSKTTLTKFRSIPTQTLVDALWVMGWPNAALPSSIKPVLPPSKDFNVASTAGQAVTLRFVPQRPDIASDKPTGVASPEYEAFELCDSDSVLVASSVGPYDSIGGDIKFLRLAQKETAGVVTDGSIRDTEILSTYKVPIFSNGSTARQGPAFMQPWEVNSVLDIGGVAVRPGDIIVGDTDGVVVVPLSVHEEVLEIASEREAVEEIIRAELEENPGSPGQYYPFRPPVSLSSPLGGLLQRKLPSTPLLQQARAFTSTATVQSRGEPTLPDTMRSVVVPQTGASDVMTLVENAPLPDVPDGCVLVRNHYSGVNFIDTYHRSGLYARELPFIAGQEASGVVARSSDPNFPVGSAVAYSTLGTYTEYTAVPTAKLLSVPDNVSLSDAASLVVQGLTAHYLTTDAHANLIQPGQWMLIHAAAGGTGQLAVQMAKRKGYNVIGTCSKKKMSIVDNLGADAVIDYGTENVVERVMEITNGVGVHCALDGVGKSTADSSLDSLAQRGICVYFGNASGPVEPVSPLRLIGKSSFVTRPKLLDYTRNREELSMRADETFQWVAEGTLDVSVDRIFPLTEAKEAHDYIEAGKTTGKLLIDLQ